MSHDDDGRDGLVRQARHFTHLDQATQLVAAREADAELGFMARLLALCSLLPVRFVASFL